MSSAEDRTAAAAPSGAVRRNLRRAAAIAAPVLAAFGLSLLLPPPWRAVALAGLGLTLAGATVFALDTIVPGFDVLSRAVSRLSRPAGDYVVLTFDDGPVEPATRRVLDALDAEGVRATFFCIGENVRANPELAAEIASRGHEVGNHGDTHALLPLRPSAVVEREIRDGARALQRATGQRTGWLRCPKGYKSRRVERLARRLGHRLVGFSYPLHDVQNPPPSELVARTLARARSGDILLLHDGHDPRKPRPRDAVVEALPGIVRGLRARGLEPLSLGEALARDPRWADLLEGAPRPDGAPEASPRGAEVNDARSAPPHAGRGS